MDAIPAIRIGSRLGLTAHMAPQSRQLEERHEICAYQFTSTHLYDNLTVIRQTPPLATAWIYAIMQLNLTYAVLSLVTTYGFIWYKNLRLFPSP